MFEANETVERGLKRRHAYRAANLQRCKNDILWQAHENADGSKRYMHSLGRYGLTQQLMIVSQRHR